MQAHSQQTYANLTARPPAWSGTGIPPVVVYDPAHQDIQHESQRVHLFSLAATWKFAYALERTRTGDDTAVYRAFQAPMVQLPIDAPTRNHSTPLSFTAELIKNVMEACTGLHDYLPSWTTYVGPPPPPLLIPTAQELGNRQFGQVHQLQPIQPAPIVPIPVKQTCPPATEQPRPVQRHPRPDRNPDRVPRQATSGQHRPQDRKPADPARHSKEQPKPRKRTPPRSSGRTPDPIRLPESGNPSPGDPDQRKGKRPAQRTETSPPPKRQASPADKPAEKKSPEMVKLTRQEYEIYKLKAEGYEKHEEHARKQDKKPAEAGSPSDTDVAGTS